MIIPKFSAVLLALVLVAAAIIPPSEAGIRLRGAIERRQATGARKGGKLPPSPTDPTLAIRTIQPLTPPPLRQWQRFQPPPQIRQRANRLPIHRPRRWRRPCPSPLCHRLRQLHQLLHGQNPHQRSPKPRRLLQRHCNGRSPRSSKHGLNSHPLPDPGPGYSRE